MAINFKLVSEFQTIHRRPFELASPEVLVPTNVRPIVDGEFLQLDAAYKMARGGDDNAGTADEALVPSFLYFAERGRYEVQAIQKGPFLYLQDYEGDILIMDGTGLAVGDALSVFDIDIGGIVRRGLKKVVAAGAWEIGRVTRLPASNNGFLRFIKTK